MAPPICHLFQSGRCHYGKDCRYLHVNNARCYNCGEQGHFSRDCPAKSYLSCNICHSTKHSSRDCCRPFQRLDNAQGYTITRTKLPSIDSNPESPFEHTPDTLLEHARGYLKLKKPDLMQVNEKVWAAASAALKRVALLGGVRLKGHDALNIFVEFLVERELVNNQNNSFMFQWDTAQSCHKSFCSMFFVSSELNIVQRAVESTGHFVNKLTALRLSEDDVISLENFIEEMKNKNDKRALRGDLVIVKS